MKVSIVMGSKSDLDLAKAAGEILDTLDVPYTINILSAHRTPELLHAHIDEATGNEELAEKVKNLREEQKEALKKENEELQS